MEGDKVNDLIKNRSSQDDDKDKKFLSVKLNIFKVAFHNLECTFLRALSVENEKYGFIPFPSGSFVDILIEASIHFKMDNTKKFLDVGCGPGTKVLLASTLFESYGLELNWSFVQTAHKIGLRKVFQNDAMLFDEYGKYDFIYFYSPFKDRDLQLKLEDRIYCQMKKGSIVAPMHTSLDWDKQSDMEKISNYLYLKS